jgi:hypothetical protein
MAAYSGRKGKQAAVSGHHGASVADSTGGTAMREPSVGRRNSGLPFFLDKKVLQPS